MSEEDRKVESVLTERRIFDPVKLNPDFCNANFVPLGQKAQRRSADYAIKEKLFNHRPGVAFSFRLCIGVLGRDKMPRQVYPD